MLQVSFAESSTDAVSATRQTYIQESINFTGAELAARLPSMQAALRAQRGAADAAAAGAAAAGAGGRPSMGSGPAAARAVSRAPGVPPVPPVTRPGPQHPAAAAISAAASGPAAAAPLSSGSSRPYADVSTAAVAAAATSSATLEVAEVAAPAYLSAQPEPEPTPSSSSQQASPSLPSRDNLQGLSVSEKMQALQQVQQVSRQALTSMPASNPYYVNAPKTIDIRMYDQLVGAHNKLSQKLSDANAHVGVLEGQINQCHEDLIAAFELMKQVRAVLQVEAAGCTSQHMLPSCRARCSTSRIQLQWAKHAMPPHEQLQFCCRPNWQVHCKGVEALAVECCLHSLAVSYYGHWYSGHVGHCTPFC